MFRFRRKRGRGIKRSRSDGYFSGLFRSRRHAGMDSEIDIEFVDFDNDFANDPKSSDLPNRPFFVETEGIIKYRYSAKEKVGIFFHKIKTRIIGCPKKIAQYFHEKRQYDRVDEQGENLHKCSFFNRGRAGADFTECTFADGDLLKFDQDFDIKIKRDYKVY